MKLYSPKDVQLFYGEFSSFPPTRETLFKDAQLRDTEREERKKAQHAAELKPMTS